MAKQRRVAGYLDGEQKRERLQFETYQYHLPFNYRNISVFRKFYEGGEFHGMELEPVNAPSPRVCVTECEPNAWFQAKTTFVVPPTAVKARFEIDVARQRAGERVLMDDAFVCEVPRRWRKTDALPGGAANLLKNASFQKLVASTGFASNWTSVGATGRDRVTVSETGAHSGKRCLSAKGVTGIALWQDMDVREGQQLLYSIWLACSRKDPEVIWLFPKFYDGHGAPVSDVAGDCIVVREEKPIVRVVVIGSACTPPGYVQVECEELASWRRKDELRTIMPVRFRINNLWGMHLRGDQWCTRAKGVERGEFDQPYEELPDGLIEVYPGLAGSGVKSDAYEFPFSGMSSAIFEVPPCERVIIRGGSEMPGWSSDHAANDGHYSFRIIRTTVVK